MLKTDWRTEPCTRFVHDDLFFWVLLEKDELRPVLEQEPSERSSG